MKTIIHVNQHKIKKNLKTNKIEPVLTIKNYKKNEYAYEAEIKDKNGVLLGKVIYSPNKPLSCGARVWIEFYSENVDIELIKTIRNQDHNCSIER